LLATTGLVIGGLPRTANHVLVDTWYRSIMSRYVDLEIPSTRTGGETLSRTVVEAPGARAVPRGFWGPSVTLGSEPAARPGARGLYQR